MIPLDSALWYGKNKKIYFFKGDKYVRYDPKKNRADDGYPKKIKDHWHGMPFNRINASLWYGKNKKAYFFSGNQYVRFNPSTNKVDPGYPKTISSGWPGVTFDRIDAALWYGKNKKVYLFRGDKYIRFDPDKNKADPGYPKKIKNHWHGLTFNRLDASVWNGENKKAYFFKGDEYTRYNPDSNKADSGYPLNTIQHWYGLPGSDGIYLKSSHVRAIIEKALSGKLKNGYKLRLGDGKYFCPKQTDAKAIIKASHVDKRRWISERFDCDDFALLLKAEFVKDAYRRGDRRSAHCFGIVWGSLPGPHAINWMINKDMKFRFIEPQNDSIFYPRATDKDIYFMLT